MVRKVSDYPLSYEYKFSADSAHDINLTDSEDSYLKQNGQSHILASPNDWPQNLDVAENGFTYNEYIKAGKFNLFVRSLKNKNQPNGSWLETLRGYTGFNKP